MSGNDNVRAIAASETYHLDRDQQRRAEALKVARETLATRTPIGATGGVNAADLVAVAEWVMTGENPWGEA